MTEIEEVRKAPPSRSAAIWLSAFPMVMGGLIAGIGLQWIPYDPAKIHAPNWVLVVAGLMFISAGFVMLCTTWNRYARLQTLFGLVIRVGLTLICHWVAFGAGERHFTSNTTFNGVKVDSRAVDEGNGRLVFGIGAIILDVVLAAMLVKLWRKRSD
jgi:hypothetical protein